MTPALSWLVIGSVVGFAVAVYLLVSVRLDRQERRFDASRTFTEPADPRIRIFGGVYDQEAHGDFE